MTGRPFCEFEADISCLASLLNCRTYIFWCCWFLWHLVCGQWSGQRLWLYWLCVRLPVQPPVLPGSVEAWEHELWQLQSRHQRSTDQGWWSSCKLRERTTNYCTKQTQSVVYHGANTDWLPVTVKQHPANKIGIRHLPLLEIVDMCTGGRLLQWFRFHPSGCFVVQPWHRWGGHTAMAWTHNDRMAEAHSL